MGAAYGLSALLRGASRAKTAAKGAPKVALLMLFWLPPSPLRGSCFNPCRKTYF